MKPEEILEAAKEAGMTIFVMESLQRYTNVIEMVIEKRTIERCAVVAEELRHPDGYSGENVDWYAGTDHAAAAIRKLGEQ